MRLRPVPASAERRGKSAWESASTGTVARRGRPAAPGRYLRAADRLTAWRALGDRDDLRCEDVLAPVVLRGSDTAAAEDVGDAASLAWRAITCYSLCTEAPMRCGSRAARVTSHRASGRPCQGGTRPS